MCKRLRAINADERFFVRTSAGGGCDKRSLTDRSRRAKENVFRVGVKK